MQIKEEKVNDIYIIKLGGRLDSNTYPGFEEKITRVIKEGAHHLVIDFENIEYLSSAGVRVVLNATKNLEGRAGRLVLCSMSDYIKEIFEIAGFDSFLSIVANVDEALKTF